MVVLLRAHVGAVDPRGRGLRRGGRGRPAGATGTRSSSCPPSRAACWRRASATSAVLVASPRRLPRRARRPSRRARARGPLDGGRRARPGRRRSGSASSCRPPRRGAAAVAALTALTLSVGYLHLRRRPAARRARARSHRRLDAAARPPRRDLARPDRPGLARREAVDDRRDLPRLTWPARVPAVRRAPRRERAARQRGGGLPDARRELGTALRRLPDGETGPRADWIVWQYPVLSARPQFEVAPPAPPSYRALPRLSLRAGRGRRRPHFGALGYADAALALLPDVRAAQARRRAPARLPLPGLPADAARAGQRLRRRRGPGLVELRTRRR